MRLCRPIVAGAHLRKRAIARLGAGRGIALTISVCAGVPLAAADLPIIVAPPGAFAALAFAVPGSPLAQPRPVVAGDIVSTPVGVEAFGPSGDTIWAAVLAHAEGRRRG